MKQKLLTVAVAAAAAFSMNAFADGGHASVYGKANLSLNSTDNGNDDTVEVVSHASRIGVKGGYDIGGSTQAVFKLEYEVAVDDGNADEDEFKARNVYAGFQGDWGGLFMGRHDTPLKTVGKLADVFNDYKMGDIKTAIVGENREDNAAWYVTPKFNGLQAALMLVQGEDFGGDNDSLGDGVSASIGYEATNFNLGLAVDDDIDDFDTIRLAGNYKGNGFQLGALYQQAEISDDADGDLEQDGFVLSAKFKVAPMWYLKAQYAQSELDLEGDADPETTVVTFGVDRKLTKKSKIYAYYSDVEEEYTATTINGTTVTTSTESDDASTFGVGYEIKF